MSSLTAVYMITPKKKKKSREYRILADNMRSRMRQLKIGQQVLAKRTKLNQPKISEIVTQKGNPTLATMITIAHGLETTLVDLLTEKNNDDV